ncbi:hypothetical protein MTO96_025167 [Rhipicephalus appendiculatus]
MSASLGSSADVSGRQQAGPPRRKSLLAWKDRCCVVAERCWPGGKLRGWVLCFLVLRLLRPFFPFFKGGVVTVGTLAQLSCVAQTLAASRSAGGAAGTVTASLEVPAGSSESLAARVRLREYCVSVASSPDETRRGAATCSSRAGPVGAVASTESALVAAAAAMLGAGEEGCGSDVVVSLVFSSSQPPMAATACC